MKVVVVVPAWNEAQVISETIFDIKKAGWENVVVVDDGSKDNTAVIAEKAGAIVVSHPVNRGVGAARVTGMEVALKNGAEAIVQMDADGQLDPGDILAVVTSVLKGEAEVVIGSRFLGRNEVPRGRRVLNWLGNLVTLIFYGKWVSDSQTGFKAFSKKAAEELETKFDTYEWESEVIREIKRHKWKYAEVPVKVRYTEYSMSKGQTVLNGFRMGMRIMGRALFG